MCTFVPFGTPLVVLLLLFYHIFTDFYWNCILACHIHSSIFCFCAKFLTLEYFCISRVLYFSLSHFAQFPLVLLLFVCVFANNFHHAGHLLHQGKVLMIWIFHVYSLRQSNPYLYLFPVAEYDKQLDKIRKKKLEEEEKANKLKEVDTSGCWQFPTL